ncbi:MAG: dephospho-CoA kinase [Candidatus Korarchaeota archaeon NZ13-K]|nr:MAG: dephospho-CoA kinase [Candidatus Korarchaeota archaeon NZ13-K]
MIGGGSEKCLGKPIVLIVGLPGSGKDEISRAIGDLLGYRVIRMSDLLLEELRRRGLSETRENMRSLGLELRERMGRGALARLAIDVIMSSPPPRCFVVNGVRNVEEIDEFVREFGDDVITIAVLTSKKIRFIRTSARMRGGFDRSSYSEFLRDDREEIIAFHLGDAIACADHFVLNDGCLEEVKWRVVSIITG